jgi:TolB-like protein/DNA-binding winged helix-turn-helix (wHTH) protein/predicted Zn-dependent protease
MEGILPPLHLLNIVGMSYREPLHGPIVFRGPSFRADERASALRASLHFRFSDFEIHVAQHELRRAGTVVHIEPQVFDLLVHLIRNRDRIVGKDELFDVVWEGRIVSEATLSSRISAARRALRDSGTDQSLIRTVFKRGFRFVGDVKDVSSAPASAATERAALPQGAAADTATLLQDAAPPALVDPPVIEGPPFQNMELGSDHDDVAVGATDVAVPFAARAGSPSGGDASLHPDRAAPPSAPERRALRAGWRSARTPLIVTAALGLVLLAVPWRLMSTSAPLPTASTQGPVELARQPEAAPARLAGAVPSIIVLPFVNLSGDASQDFVADGVTDSLISDLARAIPGISLVSRDTAFTYRGRRPDARQIGRELSVRYLLDGSVVVEGQRVRVNVQLVETKEGSQLWSERFDTERKGLLQLQDEIVGRVSRSIGLKVVDLEARRSQLERPNSTQVMDLILRGKATLNLPSSPATMIEARSLFEQALTDQPNSVDGLAGVASTLVFEFLNGYYEAEGDQRLQKAERLLDRAGAIEPGSIMVLKARAALRRAQGKFDDAIAAAEAIIMENPGEPWAYKEIGLSTMYLGTAGQALDSFAKADLIAPRDPGRWTWLDGRGHALILLGRDAEAIRALTGALDANPRSISTHAFLAASYALLGRPDEARASLATYLQSRPESRVSTFRLLSPVPLVLTSPVYRQQYQRIKAGLLTAGMPE